MSEKNKPDGRIVVGGVVYDPAAELAKSKELVTLLLGELASVPGIGWNDYGEPYYITHNGIPQQIPPHLRRQLKARAKRIHGFLEKYAS